MEKKRLEQFKKRLEERQQELRRNVSRTEQDGRSADLDTAQATADGQTKASGSESGAIEVAMRKLSDGLAAGFGRLPGSGRYRRLAVLTFSEVGERARQKKLGTIVTAEVATNLKRDHGLFLIAGSYLIVSFLHRHLEGGAQISVAWQTVPYIVLTTAEPGDPACRSARKSAEGFATGLRPAPVISKTPSSDTAPKRFFTALTIRWCWRFSPSK